MLERNQLVSIHLPGLLEDKVIVLEVFPEEKRYLVLGINPNKSKYGYVLDVLEQDVEITGKAIKLPADMAKWPANVLKAFLINEMSEHKHANDRLGRNDPGATPSGASTNYRHNRAVFDAYTKRLTDMTPAAGNSTTKKLLELRKEYLKTRVFPVDGSLSREVSKRIRARSTLRKSTGSYGLVAQQMDYVLPGRRYRYKFRPSRKGSTLDKKKLRGRPAKLKKQPIKVSLEAVEAELEKLQFIEELEAKKLKLKTQAKKNPDPEEVDIGVHFDPNDIPF